jgi:uncharacterized protein YuzE
MEPMSKVERAELQAAYVQGLHAILAANLDLDDRLRAATVEALYDPEDDVLEIRVDGPQEAVSENLSDDLWLRMNIETNKIVGLELEHYRNHAGRAGSREWQLVASVLHAAGVHTLLTPVPSATEPRVQPLDAMRALVAT